MKSRVFISRTISKVKSRISSSHTISNRDSRKPLISSLTFRSQSPSPSATPSIARRPSPPQFEGANDSPDQSPIEPSGTTELLIAVPSIATSSLTIPTSSPKSKYIATAYININVSCTSHSTTEPKQLPPVDNVPAIPIGHLTSLSLTSPTFTGPATLLSHLGTSNHPTLHPQDDNWITVLHIGIKDTSLASRLSTSIKKSARNMNLKLIDKWLDVLKKDEERYKQDDGKLGEEETVVVNGKLRFGHSLLPKEVECVISWQCMVDVGQVGTAEEMGEVGSDEDGDDEERLREMRVLGAPWL